MDLYTIYPGAEVLLLWFCLASFMVSFKLTFCLTLSTKLQMDKVSDYRPVKYLAAKKPDISYKS